MRPRLAFCYHAAPDEEQAVALALEAVPYAGVELTLDPERPWEAVDLAERMRAVSLGKIDTRFHFPLCRFEISHADPERAREGLAAMTVAVRAIAASGGGILTVHAALPDEDRASARFRATCDRLSTLVDLSGGQGVAVCLENLRWGATSDPLTFALLVERSGAGVTFDVGHATSSDAARNGFGAERFADLMGPSIIGAHVYDREEEVHHAPQNLERIAPALDRLLASSCDWWTIELTDADDVRRTRAMLTDYLDEPNGGGGLGSPAPTVARTVS